MRILFPILIILGLLSCQKNEFDNDLEVRSAPEYYLEFKVSEVGVFGESVTESSDPIYCTQDVELESYITEAREIYGIWRITDDLEEDSIWVNCQLRFDIEGIENLEIPIDLIFLYKESKEMLEFTSNNQYTYKSKEHLAEKLRTMDWTNFDWRGLNSLMVFSVQLDNPIIEEVLGDDNHGFDIPEINNTMFYYDWENFSFTNVHYSEVTDKIVLEGEFDVSLKLLSCGFWNFVNINDAHFRAMID